VGDPAILPPPGTTIVGTPFGAAWNALEDAKMLAVARCMGLHVRGVSDGIFQMGGDEPSQQDVVDGGAVMIVNEELDPEGDSGFPAAGMVQEMGQEILASQRDRLQGFFFRNWNSKGGGAIRPPKPTETKTPSTTGR